MMLEGASLQLLAGVGFGIALGWLLRSKTGRKILPSAELKDDEDSTMGEMGEYKMVFVVRQDLKMGKGKVAAQCSHAAVSLYKKMSRSNPDLLLLLFFLSVPMLLYPCTRKCPGVTLTCCCCCFSSVFPCCCILVQENVQE
ncbi:peptidyl-tRNA hydrolase 2, mitochondrial-like isoform X2 [Branchiostoma floridae x Branchiostoma belcheri]